MRPATVTTLQQLYNNYIATHTTPRITTHFIGRACAQVELGEVSRPSGGASRTSCDSFFDYTTIIQQSYNNHTTGIQQSYNISLMIERACVWKRDFIKYFFRQAVLTALGLCAIE